MEQSFLQTNQDILSLYSTVETDPEYLELAKDVCSKINPSNFSNSLYLQQLNKLSQVTLEQLQQLQKLMEDNGVSLNNSLQAMPSINTGHEIAVDIESINRFLQQSSMEIQTIFCHCK